MIAANDISAPAAAAPWYRNWRFWLGMTIMVACLSFAMRGVPLGDVLEAMRSADLVLLLAVSIPSYVATVFVRALRWRHLTNPITPMPRAALFRACGIGFMVNNVVPLRIGELVRSWYLARETGTSATAILGTVVLERVLDVVTVLLLAVASLAWIGADGEASVLSQGALYMLPVAGVLLVGLIVMRVAPEPVARLTRWGVRPLPERIGSAVVAAVERFGGGLGALSGGSHLFWIALHSALIWLVFSTLPFLAALYAFGLELGPPLQTLVTTWVLLAAVGVAVAIPSAPGFIGPYQLAFVEVLRRFGVDQATGLALGLLVWFIFWITLTLQGLLLLRVGGVALRDLTRQPGKDPLSDRR